MSTALQQSAQKGGEEESGGDDGAPAGVRSPWEWVAAAASALLVVGAIGFLGYEAVGRGESPPQIGVRVERIIPRPGQFLVMIQARNTGGTTAHALMVEGELRSDTGVVERSQATIDYVPSGAARKAGLFFSHDPRRYAVRVRPTGYDEP